MPKMPMAQILELGMIAVVWTLQVRLNNKVNFQITNVARLYWCLPIIIFQMLLQQINQILRRNHLPVLSLSLTNSLPELKNTGREILTVTPVVKLAHQSQELACPTQICRSCHKMVKMLSSTVAPTGNNPYLTLTLARRKKQITNNHKKGVKVLHKTLLCFNNDQ